jgi:heme/copper-type cytochrome/quinol oxidase subunit 2
MPIVVVVKTPEEYEAWLKSRQQATQQAKSGSTPAVAQATGTAN